MNALTEIIRSEIERAGVISFARFMELALYHPHHGYYETTANFIGKQGDYFTSVSVGSLFGELLAFQCAEWLAEEAQTRGASPKVLQLVEAGAHDGQLAADILTWMRQCRPALFEATTYWIVEPSPRRREWQEEKLREFAGRVRWRSDLPGSSTPSEIERVNGIIFSNELLDAMPVHRLRWDAAQQRWFKWGVGIEGDRFAWRRMTLAGAVASAAHQLPAELAEFLPDGFTTEVCPSANRWWRDAARWLRQGRLLTFDYGLKEGEFLLPQRVEGTLRSYRRHRFVDDLLARPGEQDLTAHVNFTALQKIGEAAGLKTEGLVAQSQFLVEIFERTQTANPAFSEWTPERVRQLQTLIHPEHLGRNFRVLIQRRVADAAGGM